MGPSLCHLSDMGELQTKDPGLWARMWAKVTGKALPTTSLDDADDYVAPSAVAGTVVTPAYDPETALSAFAAFPWVRACITAKVEDLAALPRYVMVGHGDNAERFDDHPVLGLLRRPNPNENGVIFTRQRLVDLFLSGNAMRAVAGVALGEPVSLHRLHPDLWDPELDAHGGIASWQGESASNSFPATEVLHDRYPSWVNDGRMVLGESPIRSLDRDLTTDLNAAKLAARLSATGQPRMMLTPDPKDPRSAANMDRDAKRRERAGWERALKESESGTVIGNRGWIATPFGLTPRDMEFEKTRIWGRDSTLAALGVPPARVGIPTANYATSREQMKVYWRTLMGEAAVLDATDAELARMFTRWAQANLGGSWRQKLQTMRVVTDFSTVEALQESRTERLQRVQTHIFNGLPPALAYREEGFEELASEMVNQPAPAPTAEPEEEETEAERRLAVNGGPRLTLFTRETPAPRPVTVKAVPGKYEHIDFTPPSGVREECARGLEWHEDGESGDGLTPPTVAWARRLADGEDISPEKARKMRAWLARHEADKEGEGFSPGEPGYPSPGRVAWALWGGDPAVGWSAKLVGQMDSADEEGRAAQWRDFIAKTHNPIERLLQHALQQALQEQAAVLAARIPDLLSEERGLHAKVLTADEVATALRIAESMGILRDAAMRYIRRALEQGLADALGAFDITDPTDARRLDRLLELRLGHMVQNVSPETKTRVRNVVVNGIEQGLTTSEVQAALMQDAAFGASRALRIARTETTTALEEGADEGYAAATQAGVKFELMWLTARDGSPPIRASHVTMDGQTRAPGESFTSGAGHHALRPGGFDIASEDINCRCTRVPKIIEEQ